MTPPRTRGRQTATGLYVLVVLTFGAYLPSALYPGYQEVFGVGDLTMTLIYAVFALVSAPALVLLGPASDALGARPVLLSGIALAAAGSACFALAPSAGWLLLGRAAQGLALGAATGAAAVLISDGSARGPRHGAVLTSIAFVAGTACGAMAGGVLAQYAPAPTVLPFVLHLALLALGWWGVHTLAPSPAARAGMRRYRPTAPRIPRGMRAVFCTASAVGFLAWTAAGLFLAIIPALLEGSGQTDMAVTGGILGAVLVFSALAQPLVPRLGPRTSQLIGLTGLLASFALLAPTSGGSTALTLAAAVVAGVGHGLAYAGAAAAIDARTPAEARGAVTGALYPAFYLGSGVPAVAVGLLTLRYPLATATSAVTAFAAALVVLTGLAVVRVDRRPRVPTRVVARQRTRPVRESRL